MRTPRRLLKGAFWRGFFLCSFAHLMIEDYMGLERYVAMVRENWVVLPWWPWLVAGLAISVWQAMQECSVTDEPIGKGVES